MRVHMHLLWHGNVKWCTVFEIYNISKSMSIILISIKMPIHRSVNHIIPCVMSWPLESCNNHSAAICCPILSQCFFAITVSRPIGLIRLSCIIIRSFIVPFLWRHEKTITLDSNNKKIPYRTNKVNLAIVLLPHNKIFTATVAAERKMISSSYIQLRQLTDTWK